MSDTTNIDSIKDKIRKLVNLGEDGGATEAEAENALRFARRLMLKHGVDQKDLEEAKDAHEAAADAEKVEYGRVDFATADAKLSTWELTLAWAVSELIGTVKFYLGGDTERRNEAGTLQFNSVTGVPMRSKVLVFYGPAEECRDAREMMREWSLAIASLGRMKFGGVFRGDGRSYCEGFTEALRAKVASIKREEHALIEAQRAQAQLPAGQTRSTALMVTSGLTIMEAKLARTQTYLTEELGLKLSKGTARYGGGRQNFDARGEGRKDGQRANFSHSPTKKLGGGK